MDLFALFAQAKAQKAAIQAAPVGTTVTAGWTKARLFGRKTKLVLQVLLEE